MTLNISLEMVQSRIQLCKEWKDAPPTLRDHARSVFAASLEALRLEELRDLYRMATYGITARDYSFHSTSTERAEMLKVLIDDGMAAKWQRALQRVTLKGLPVLI
jgi:hypothetical protein